MKATKKISVFILFFCLTISLQSQNSIKAKKLLDDASVQINSYENYEFDFKYILENSKENIRQETSGKIIVMGEKYKLSTTGIIQLFDGDKLYTIIPENEEVLITDSSSGDEIITNPGKLIELYKTGYDFYWDISQNVTGNYIQYVKLIPTEENLDVMYILLGINIKTKDVYKLIEIGKQRTTTTLSILNFKTNKNISSSIFNFNETDYPGYYID
tara:strand:+ start:1700 stop:2344 length:645 start_codon:yes stop_codon:yes gene_type:complete